MKHFVKAVCAASALLVAAQAHATDYVIDHSNADGTGNPASPFYVQKITSTSIKATINGISPAVGSFTDTFTFFLPFDAYGSGAVISTNFTDLDLTSGFLDIYNAAGTAVAYEIPATLSSSGLSVALNANGGIPANVKVVLTVNGTVLDDLGTYSGNLSATSVPEPATWALLLVGFGAVGYSMRRRSAQRVKVSFA